MAPIETSPLGEIGAAPRPQAESPAPARSRRHFAGLLSILAGLALWEFLSRLVVANALFLAAPSQIFAAIYNLAASGQLWPHISISAVESAIGYVIASLLGIVVAFVIARTHLATKILHPRISWLYPTPPLPLP